MKNPIFFLLTVILPLFLSCNNSNNKTKSQDATAVVYKLDKIDEKASLSWDHLKVESVIPLETNDQSTFGDINKAWVHENKMILLDWMNQNLLVFDTNGKFLHKIGKKGKGPGEYLEVRDFMVVGNNVYTLDYQKIHTYELSSGKYMSTLTLTKIKKFNPTHFIYFSKDNYYLWSSRPGGCNEKTTADYFRLLHFINGKLANRYFKYTNPAFSINRFFNSSEGFLMQPALGDNNVYRITEKSVTNIFTIDFGDRGLPKNYFEKLDKCKIDFNDLLQNAYFKNINRVFETKDYIYFECIGPKTYVYGGFIDKRTKHTNFGNTGAPCIFYSDSNYFYAYYTSSILSIKNENPKKSIFTEAQEKTKKFHLTPEDNAVILKLAINK